uniref:Mitochondrial ribosomal protein L30 n=1 Tax=Coturnix japonica TaxID=93934 RepID=A0A8C2SK45_COTJA
LNPLTKLMAQRLPCDMHVVLSAVYPCSDRNSFTGIRSLIKFCIFSCMFIIHQYYFSKSKFAIVVYILLKSFVNRDVYLETLFLKPILSFIQAHQPRLHKNIPSVNSKLKVVKHLIRIQPLKLPHGLPTEEEMADTFLTSNGELIIRQRLKPVEQEEIKS